ncbi:hypothetical protein EVAR_22157_1 [Eumeta japonica]|uniref:Uncharacterized protein n=1 Tax=Eumeta variegata TaxID=151549 RepID=A0A4C1VZN8_EUMVA|nr:hypothetical protein EVAR_22157_1 [Eumeta japonica]
MPIGYFGNNNVQGRFEFNIGSGSEWRTGPGSRSGAHVHVFFIMQGNCKTRRVTSVKLIFPAASLSKHRISAVHLGRSNAPERSGLTLERPCTPTDATKNTGRGPGARLVPKSGFGKDENRYRGTEGIEVGTAIVAEKSTGIESQAGLASGTRTILRP